MTIYLRIGLCLFLLPPNLYSQKPLWVNNPPADSRYYHGVGQSLITSPDSKQNARQNAFEEIALQISTEISVLSKRSIIADDKVSDVKFANEVVVSALSNFKDIELVGEYADRRSFYIYHRYSKENHRKQIETAANRAKEFYKPYAEREPVEFVEKLSDLVKSYEQLHYTYGEPVEIATASGKVNLWTKVVTELETVLRTVSVKTDLGTRQSTKYKAVYGYPLSEPLRTNVSVVLPSPYNTVSGTDLPVEYMFIEGNGDFRISTTMVDERGISEGFVSKIQSLRPNQVVKARINLKLLKENPNPSAYFDSRLDKISDYSHTTFSLEISERKNDVIAIYVKSSTGISNIDVRRLNEVFEEAFSNISEFEIIDRSRAETILLQQGQNSADVCDSEECRIQIAKTLRVDKFILIDIRASSSDKILSCQFRLTDVTEGTFQDIKTFEEKYRGSSPVQAATQFIPKWAAEYYNILNPAVVNFTANSLVKTPVNLYMNNKYLGMTLPVLDYSLDKHGTYNFTFVAPGYEPLNIRYSLTPENQLVVNEEIVLNRKTRSKAMIRSLIYPGWGQSYSSDPSFPKRETVGRVFSLSAILSASASVASWYGYFESRTRYKSAYNNYKNAKLLPALIETREEMREVHSEMTSFQSIAISLSSLYAGIWLLGSLETIISFPNYGIASSNTHNDVKLTYDDELKGANLSINVSF